MSRVGETFPYQAADLNQDGQQAWGPLERAVLSAIIDTVQQAVTVDGLDVNGDLDLQGHGLINSAFVQFVLSGDVGLLRQQWVDSNGDLWYRDGQNRAVQVTTGGALAVSAALGGFAGDYTATNPSGATYDNSTGKFSFTAPSPAGQSAIINGGPIQLRQGSDTDYVGLAVPASLPGTYTLTFPSTLPAGQHALVEVDITGGLNYRLSSSFTESIDVAQGAVVDGTVVYGNGGWSNFTGGSDVDIGINYQVGDRIDAVTFGTTGAPVTASILFRSDDAKFAILARCAFNDGVAGAHTIQAGTATLTGTLPIQTVATGSYYLRIGSVGNISLQTVRVTRMRKIVS